MNARSLSLHFDELVSTLATLKIETWNSIQNSLQDWRIFQKLISRERNNYSVLERMSLTEVSQH